MSPLARLGRDAVQTLSAYWKSRGSDQAISKLCENLRFYCMFIGYPRSGHSLVGGLLDAHRHAVVAHEAGALRYLTARVGRHRLFRILIDNARAKATRGARAKAVKLRPSIRYSYHVSGQWQGTHEEIRVIGDKHGEGATLRLGARPWLLERLRATVGVPVRLIHVVRNPYDNIATMARRAARRGEPDLAGAARRYFGLCETVDRLRSSLDAGELWELRHEDFVSEPGARLRELCEWLELEPSRDYLETCARIVYETPQRSRGLVEWSPDTRGEVERRIAHHPHLAGYGFDD